MKRGKVRFHPTRSPRYELCVLCVREQRDSKGAHHWHHLISIQRLRHYVADQHLETIEAFALHRKLVNDQRNLLALCVHHHLDAKGGLTAVIPRDLVPEPAWEFAREIGLEHVLEKHYV